MNRTVKYVILLIGMVLLFAMVYGCADEKRGIAVLYNKGHKMMGRDLEGSIELFSQVIELDPGFVDAYVNRGAALGELGRYEEAIPDFNKAIQLDPDCYEVRDSPAGPKPLGR